MIKLKQYVIRYHCNSKTHTGIHFEEIKAFSKTAAIRKFRIYYKTEKIIKIYIGWDRPDDSD